MEVGTIEGWHWLVVGALLLILELLTPGALLLLFFGASAIVVGLLAVAGLPGPLWWQIVLFAALSLGGLLALRPLVLTKFHLTGSHRAVDTLVGETALALEELATESLGKVELRGSTWNARNAGDNKLSRGQRCVVVKVDGLTLWVRDK